VWILSVQRSPCGEALDSIALMTVIKDIVQSEKKTLFNGKMENG